MAFNARVIVLLTVLVILVFAEGATSAETIIVGFQDSQVQEMTLEELNRRKIGYQPAGNNSIRFNRADLEEVTEIVRAFTYEVLPPDRSVNYVKELQLQLIERLDAADVPYEIVEYGDLESLPEEWVEDGLTREWIVWSEKHSAQVAEILEAFQQESLSRDAMVD